MALITCGECGAMVSDKAAACPKCGNPAGGVPHRSPLTIPPREVRLGGILFGLCLLATGAWILLALIPQHDPSNLVSLGLAATGSTWVFNQQGEALVQLMAVGTLVLGVAQLATGSMTPPAKVGFCPKCHKDVVGQKTWRGWRCSKCSNRLRA